MESTHRLTFDLLEKEGCYLTYAQYLSKCSYQSNMMSPIIKNQPNNRGTQWECPVFLCPQNIRKYTNSTHCPAPECKDDPHHYYFKPRRSFWCPVCQHHNEDASKCVEYCSKDDRLECVDHRCKDDPLHKGWKKFNHTYCLKCSSCHYKGIAYCELCKGCHEANFTYCNECNKCNAEPDLYHCNVCNKCDSNPIHCNSLCCMNDDPHHTHSSKKNHKYCTDCKGCHASTLTYCKGCNKCYTDPDLQHCNTCGKCYLKVISHHCESYECVEDPHHIRYYKMYDKYCINCSKCHNVKLIYCEQCKQCLEKGHCLSKDCEKDPHHKSSGYCNKSYCSNCLGCHDMDNKYYCVKCNHCYTHSSHCAYIECASDPHHQRYEKWNDKFCNQCQKCHKFSLRSWIILPGVLTELVIEYFDPDSLWSENKYCGKCNACFSNRFGGGNFTHCDAFECKDDPHHGSYLKRSNKLCNACGKCHNNKYVFCSKCNRCHNDSENHCDLCNGCHRATYKCSSYCNVCKTYYKKLNDSDHCNAPECAGDPHHKLKLTNVPTGSLAGNFRYHSSAYWCKVCRLHWNKYYKHDKSKCNLSKFRVNGSCWLDNNLKVGQYDKKQTNPIRLVKPIKNGYYN